MSPATHLRDVFGFDAFRPGQEEIVDAVTDGHDVLATRLVPTEGRHPRGGRLC